MTDIAKKIPGQNDPLPVELEPRDIVDLMNGKTEPKNDMVAYFVDKLKALSTEGSELQAMRTKGREQIAMLEKRMAVIQCETGAYSKDLSEWHKRTVGEG